VIEPGIEDLAELAKKYGTLAEMRRRELAGLPPREDAHYRSIARRFPGALKELDQLELEEIDRRAAELALAARTAEIALWMRVVYAYHGFLRAALKVKLAWRREKRAPAGAGLSTTVLAELATSEAGFAITAVEIEELLLPGRCRVVQAATTFVVARTGASLADVRAALAIRRA
jgi:hypothetical protein